MKIQWEKLVEFRMTVMCYWIISNFYFPEFKTKDLNANPRLDKFQRIDGIQKRNFNYFFFSSKFYINIYYLLHVPYLFPLRYILFKNCKVIIFHSWKKLSIFLWHFFFFFFFDDCLQIQHIYFLVIAEQIKSKINRKQWFQGKKINFC